MTAPILMVEPDYYKIEYAINPFMLDENGKLKQVDAPEARRQWTDLVHLYKKIGVEVHVLKAQEGLPDMVYAANNAVLFVNPATGKKTALMGRMKSSFRQPEVLFFEEWYREHGYVIEHLKGQEGAFEGCGDALVHPGDSKKDQPLIWGGYGHRTDKNVYNEISERFGFKIIPLELIRQDFYHLDTCFAILNQNTVAIQTAAFKKSDLSLIHEKFEHVIELDLNESLRNFAANCFCPNGRDVLVQKGSPGFVKSLQNLHFLVHEVETSEFIKGGGSVFCLKMALL